MKIAWFTLIVWGALSISLSANPFSREDSATKARPHNAKLTYHGYAHIFDEHIAIIELGGKQHTVKVGEQLQGIKFMYISDRYMRYTDHRKTYTAPIQSVPSQEHGGK